MRDQSTTLAVILAAGHGTRMRSRTPKVLHPLGGQPMVDYVIESCREAGVDEVVVVISPHHEQVRQHLERRCEVVLQPQVRGTGDAVAQVPAERLRSTSRVLVLNGDMPLVQAETIQRVLDAHQAAGAAGTLASVDDSTRPDGRVIRSQDGSFARIVEHRDATAIEQATTEINVGIYCFAGPALVEALAQLNTNNAQSEYYLTDVFRTLRPVEVVELADVREGLGINDRVQLARAEAVLRERTLHRLMLSGVTVIDPTTTYVEPEVEIGQDTVLEPLTILRGRTVIGEGCHLGPEAEIIDSVLGERVRVSHSWIKEAQLASDSDCGPFSKLRPGTEIARGVHVGSFAELVRTRIGEGSKVPHVSYLGDATVGERVNIAAGTITANYDGEHKHPTVIEDEVFLGVDSMLVAPIRIGRGARTGAGSVVTKDLPPGVMAVGAPARVIRR
ncbi:MAG: bifunctional UDP-N-acetylglucosamine diphosphorylase/glucosamine-1-phosphate N-acetyltransferase GlmU [Candidatus Dormibacteraceae bacterium]